MKLRPYREDDFDPLLDLFNRHQLAAFGEADATADELRTWLTTPYVDVERDIRLLVDDGRLLGYADVDPTRDEPPRWWCDVRVDPEVDAGEAVSLLVGWIDGRAAPQGGTVRVWTSETDTRVTGAFGALGFEPSRHSYRMEIDLAEATRAPVWPEGVTVRTVGEDEHERVYEAVVEVWRDTNDPIDETFDEWAHWTSRHESFEPSLWFLATAGDELAGFSLCRADPVDPDAGYVASLGVRRPRRRQGLGEALLLQSFAAFRERGWTRGTLGVDASSRTGATRLYERAGMRVYRDTVFMERPVAALLHMTKLRAPVDADATAIVKLRSRHSPEPFSEERLRLEWTAPGFDRERDARFGDEGYVALVTDDERRTWIELHGEHPEILLAWALERAPAGRRFSGGWESDGRVRRALESAGLGLVRHSYRMAIDLAAVPRPAPLPCGLELRSFRSGDERPVYETHMEIFEDSWEHVREPYEHWLHWTLERPGFDPELWLLALEQGLIAGIALCRPHESEPEVGWVTILGVRRQWRRRGLGEALLRASFAKLAGCGCSRAVLGVDAESLTGAHRLYERAGMHIACRFDIYEKTS